MKNTPTISRDAAKARQQGVRDCKNNLSPQMSQHDENYSYYEAGYVRQLERQLAALDYNKEPSKWIH